MIILRSTGPVISTRRSCRSAGTGAHTPVARADVGGLGQEVGPLTGVERVPDAPRAAASSSMPPAVERAVQLRDELHRLRYEDLGQAGDLGAADLDARGWGDVARHGAPYVAENKNGAAPSGSGPTGSFRKPPSRIEDPAPVGGSRPTARPLRVPRRGIGAPPRGRPARARMSGYGHVDEPPSDGDDGHSDRGHLLDRGRRGAHPGDRDLAVHPRHRPEGVRREKGRGAREDLALPRDRIGRPSCSSSRSSSCRTARARARPSRW